MRSPKEIKQGGRTVFVNQPSHYLRPLVHTASSKTCLVNDITNAAQKEMRRSSIDGDQKKECAKPQSVAHHVYLTMAATQYSEDRDEFEIA